MSDPARQLAHRLDIPAKVLADEPVRCIQPLVEPVAMLAHIRQVLGATDGHIHKRLRLRAWVALWNR